MVTDGLSTNHGSNEIQNQVRGDSMISGFHGAPTLPGTDYLDSMRDSPWLLNHVTSILWSNFVENELLI